MTKRRTVVVEALWSNDVTPARIASAERYADSLRGAYDNVRVRVYDGTTPQATRR